MADLVAPRKGSAYGTGKSLESVVIDTARGFIDRRIFSDEEIHAREMERIFARCWLFLGHEFADPEPGRLRHHRMGEDPIILTATARGGSTPS